jgi:hypothetical protein
VGRLATNELTTSELIDQRLEAYRRKRGSVVLRNCLRGERKAVAMPESAEYWQNRADEAKAEADKMHDAECKEIMLDIAKAYERIADFARQGRQDPKPTKQ